nr:hypothetical protein [Halorubrum sp. BOL3-1]
MTVETVNAGSHRLQITSLPAEQAQAAVINVLNGGRTVKRCHMSSTSRIERASDNCSPIGEWNCLRR